MSISGCLWWLSQSLSGSLAGRVRRMREAYRVVRCTLRVTTCSCCPWSPHRRAEWAVAPSPQTAKCQGSLHQDIELSAPQQVRCELLCCFICSLFPAFLCFALQFQSLLPCSANSHISSGHVFPQILIIYFYYDMFLSNVFCFLQSTLCLQPNTNIEIHSCRKKCHKKSRHQQFPAFLNYVIH